MNIFIIFVIGSVVIQQAIMADVANASQPSCTRLHEKYSTCSNNCEPTCENYQDPPMCIQTCVEGGGCYCESSYVRNSAGDCVEPSECPQVSQKICPLNSKFNDCGTACPITCDNYKNPPSVCMDICVADCYCESPYVKTSSGECALPAECPQGQVSQPICPLNSKYNECGSACPITCDNYKNPPTMCTANCVADCYCESSYVKTSSGDCVLPSECPQVSEPICPLHSKYNECGSACPITCDNYKNPPSACTRQCVADCYCQSPYVKDNVAGTCVLTTQCKPKAIEPQKPIFNRYCIGSNEVYNPRGTLCPRTCATKNAMIKCAAGTQPGCFCAAGYLRNSRNRCVRVRNCD